MIGAVSMRSLYIHADAAQAYWPQCQVIEVSGLLRELILALTAEPIDYPLGGRAEQVAALILSAQRIVDGLGGQRQDQFAQQAADFDHLALRPVGLRRCV